MQQSESVSLLYNFMSARGLRSEPIPVVTQFRVRDNNMQVSIPFFYFFGKLSVVDQFIISSVCGDRTHTHTIGKPRSRFLLAIVIPKRY